MRGKFMTGAVLGAVAGMLIVPQLDRNTRNRLRRSGRMVKNTAEDMYDSMRDWVK